MAASANNNNNISGNQQEQSSFNGVASTSNGNSGPGTGSGHDNSGTASAMKHNPGIATDWTAEEQSILDAGLSKYASTSSILRYAKIAMELPNKTVRDVALRARWMNKKESSKRRKEDHPRKNKDKREKITDSSSKSSQLHAPRPAGHSYPMPPVSLDDEDGISYKSIGGPAGDLLLQNKQYFQQISANFSSYQIQENIALFRQVRDNIKNLLSNHNVTDTPEIMKQMPVLPVRMNEDYLDTILHQMSHHHHQQS